MIIQLTVTSQSHGLVKLVGEFAEGLDCDVDLRDVPYPEVRAKLPEETGADLLLHLLSYVALSAVKLGLDTSEPKYRVQFREPKAPAAVTLDFSVSAIDLGEGEAPGEGSKRSH